MQEQTKTVADCHPEHSNPANWHLGIFYFAPKDPNVVVAKRRGWQWGATVNFARPASYMLLSIPFVIGAAIVGCVAIFGQ